MKKKTVFLLCLAVFVGCLFCATGCVESEVHKHDYVEHAEIAATCTTDGTDLYYTCKGCTKIFDKNKTEISEIPVQKTAGHIIEWVKSNDCKTAELKCVRDGCSESKGTINLTVDETQRLIADYETTTTINLALFGEGLTVNSVRYLQKSIPVIVDGNNVSFVTSDLFDYAVGKVAVQLTVAKEGKEIEVEMLLTVANLVENIDDLLALRPELSDNNATVTGGEVKEVDGHSVVIGYYYLLMADLDGTTRTGKTVYGENIIDAGDASGNAKSGFVGIFDGGNHTISNYEMNVRGFFGHVGCGTIANVTFSNIALKNAQSAVLGKLMNATVSDVIIENIEIETSLGNISGIMAYHEIFGSTLGNVTIDVRGLTENTHVLAYQLTDGTGTWKSNSFNGVTVKADYNGGLRLTSQKTLTDAIDGVTVEFSPFTIEKPIENTETYYYTGHELTYNVAASDLYIVSGNKQTEIGNYTVTVSLKPYSGLTWDDGTTADVTFTFKIIELSDDIATRMASEFTAKVTELYSDFTAPRDIIALNELSAEYDVLHIKVQEMLTETANKLNEMKTAASVYKPQEVTFDSVKLITALSGYDKYYLVIYNPTDSDAPFYYASGKDWRDDGRTTLAAKAYTQVELKVDFAAEGNVYVYANGKSIGFDNNSDGWLCYVYGIRDEAEGVRLATEFTDLVAQIGNPLTIADAERIVAARNAYNALTPYALTLIEKNDLDKLVSAEAEIVNLKNEAAAKVVADMIDALTNESSAEEVVATSNAYDQLTVEQKAYITVTQLEKLQAQIARVEESVIVAKAEAFEALVNALGTPVFPRDNDSVTELTSQYAVLEESVKARLADAKAKLDEYTEKAAEYERLTVVFGSDRIETALTGYDEYYLVIYNPTDASVPFYYAGNIDWAGAGHTALAPKAYTQIIYEKKFAAAGNSYMYANGKTINFNDAESGWLCKVYGKKSQPGTVVVALSVNGKVDNETYGKVLETSAANGYFEKWGTMTRSQLESLAVFDDVYFYIYNPSDVDVYFFFQENKNWNGLDRTLLKAKSWTKVSVVEALALPEGATMVYVDVDKNTEGITLEGWMISDFFGTIKK